MNMYQMHQPLIRTYQTSDHPALITLWQECGLNPRAGEDSAGLAAISQRNPGLFLIAIDGANTLIGSVLGTYDGRRGWINHLCVTQNYRHLGLASQLLETVEAKLYRQGCQQINLLIYPDNSYDLEEWYGRRGYQKRELIFMYKEASHDKQ